MPEIVPITIGGLNFQCMRLREANFSDRAAIYVVICVEDAGDWSVLDIGQSGEVGTRLDDHERRECWKRNCTSGNIWVCVYPMPSSRYTKQQRLDYEHKLRQECNPPCGNR